MGTMLMNEVAAGPPRARERSRPRAAPADPSNGAWTSSLGHADLACLLQVIESQLLPRLLREFRAADQGPLGSAGR